MVNTIEPFQRLPVPAVPSYPGESDLHTTDTLPCLIE